MGNEISNCCELSCDEAIVRSLDIKEKKTYGNTLLASLESAGKYKNTHASVTLTQSAELIKERLDAIMTFKRKSKLITAVTIILTLLLLTGTAGIGAYAAPKVSSPSTSHTPIEKSQDSDTQTTKNSAASTKAYDKEYANWNITVKENDYYYKESLVRIFMDLRNDGSFENSFVNDNGAIDIKLIRNRAGSIISVEQIDEQEANEILEDFDISQDSIERLTKNDLPSNILAALNECTEKSWYVLEDSKTQYIYYAALPRDYSFQIDGSNLSIYDIGKKTGHYVLLAVPKTSGLIINYNSKAMTFTRISL